MKKLITICLIIAATFTVKAQKSLNQLKLEIGIELSKGEKVYTPNGSYNKIYYNNFIGNIIQVHQFPDIIRPGDRETSDAISITIDMTKVTGVFSNTTNFGYKCIEIIGENDAIKIQYKYKGDYKWSDIVYKKQIALASDNKKLIKLFEEYAKTAKTRIINLQQKRSKVENKEVEPKYKAVANFIDSLCVAYKYKDGMPKSEFRSYNSEAGNFMDRVESYSRQKNYTIGKSYRFYGQNSPEEMFNVTNITFDDFGGVNQYCYDIIKGKGKDKGIRCTENYNKMVELIESTIPKEFIKKTEDNIEIFNPQGLVYITFRFSQYSKKEGHFSIWFRRNGKYWEEVYGN
jgi:hypothetical protein